MTEQLFSDAVRSIVAEYVNDHLVHDMLGIDEDEVYIVWECKILQNNKALASTPLEDGMYYEVTYNGNKGEFYLDAYKKTDNQVFELDEEEEDSIDDEEIGEDKDE